MTAAAIPLASALELLRQCTRGKVTTDGQGTGTCPVCKRKDKFTFRAGDNGYLVVDCKTCTDPDPHAEDRLPWLAAVRAATPDVPESAWGPVGQAGRSGPRGVPQPPTPEELVPNPKCPTAAQVAWWADALLRPDGEFIARSLGKRLGLTAEHLIQAEVGYNPDESCPVMLPVRDPETGLLLTVLRRSFAQGADPKSMIWPGSSGAYVYAPFGIRDDEPVILVGGEKDALALGARGYNAVSFTNGEGAVPAEARLRCLTDHDVIVAYDVDPKGRSGAKKVAVGIAPVARTVRVADWALLPNLPEKGDAFDALNLHGSDGVDRVLAAAVPWGEDDTLRRIREMFQQDDTTPDDYAAHVIYDDELMALDPPTFVVEDWVPRGFVSVFWGKPGVFKTFLLNEMMRCVRLGLDWQGYATTRGMTLMLQGEGLEQLQPRIAAWDSYNDVDPRDMEPGGYLDVQPNIATPEGVAAIARTVRAMETQHAKRVELVVLDPLVEFIPSNERVESTDLASRGLRALARFLDCAVVVGHHANAEGGRARGTDHLYMRAGAHVSMEELEDGRIGVFQHKQKSRAKQALILKPTPYEDSVVLTPVEALLAEDYVAQRTSQRRKQGEAAAADQGDKKVRAAGALLVAALKQEPGLSKTAVVQRCMNKGYGKDTLEETLRLLVADGVLRVEGGARHAHCHYVNDG